MEELEKLGIKMEEFEKQISSFSNVSKGNRIKVSIYFLEEPTFNGTACKYAILYLNSQQYTFEFQFPENESHLDSYSITDDQKKFAESLKETEFNFNNAPSFFRFQNFLYENNFAENAVIHVGIIDKPIDGNLFFESWINMIIITAHKWDKLFSPPSVFEYIIHCLNASIVQLATSIDSHDETRGCVVDYTRFKEDDKVDITLGYICDDCSSKIKEKSGEEFLQTIKIIASHNWIGSVDKPDSLAYNLKKYYKVDIEKDSGFNKSYWEKAKEHFPELPLEILKTIINPIVTVIVTLGILYLTGSLK